MRGILRPEMLSLSGAGKNREEEEEGRMTAYGERRARC